MTEPPSLLTPAEVARFLMGLTRQLDNAVEDYRVLSVQHAEAKRQAVLSEARAYIESAPEAGEKRTVDERKAYTALNCGDDLFHADLALAKVQAAKEKIRALHARLDVGRTLSATSREEMRGYPGGGGQT